MSPKLKQIKKNGDCSSKVSTEDPSFKVSIDHESGQTVMKGMGELHLEILVDRMLREFKVDATVGAPQVAYRETITKPTTIDYTHKKQSGGAGQFAKVVMEFEPLKKVKALFLKVKLLEAECLKNISQVLKRVLNSQQKPDFWLAFLLLI